MSLKEVYRAQFYTYTRLIFYVGGKKSDKRKLQTETDQLNVRHTRATNENV